MVKKRTKIKNDTMAGLRIKMNGGLGMIQGFLDLGVKLNQKNADTVKT